jgi:WD40 repeat protein/energy-coupling factor transporter ATP-binding protein EcfA2
MAGSRRYAFIAGINRYGKNIPPLGSAVRDARAIARVLADVHGYEVDLHLDEDATLEKLRAVFNGLPGKVGADDRAVIYFAGHGIAESGDADADGPRGYFVPQDADRDDLGSFLPMAEVQRALDQLTCKHVLILLDCCFAGAFKWSKTRAMGGRPTKKLTRERYERYLRDPARQVITSASSNETALDVVSGKVLGTRDTGADHSPFALALISALRDAVADVGYDGQKGDGVTTATELHLYIESVMARAEQGLGRQVQKPMLWAIDDRGHGGEFIFETPGQQLDLPSALVLSEENNPYRGLESYDEKHAAMFFGREKLTVQLAEAVAGQSLTLVVGASGSGKSSLVKAGLVHHLKQTAKRWAIMPPIRPGTAPLRALESAAAAIEAWSAGGEVAPAPADARPPTLARAARGLRAREPELEVLLIVDQLEELVTMASGKDQRARFFAALEDARTAGLRVVCTLRADFEPHFLELARSSPGARFPVRSMSRDELREVIEGPAHEQVLEFTPPSLVGALIDEVHDSPGALPLLSFTLSELYRERIKRDARDRALSGDDYDKLGGVTGALGTRADKIYDGQPDEAARQTMARVLLRLVSLKGGEAAKRRVPRRELVSTDPTETARAERIVNELSEARLVVEGREDDGSQPGAAPAGDAHTYVEAAHDKLVTGWRKLWEILAEHRDDLPLLRSCTVAAEEWDAAKRDDARLWNADPRLPLLQALRKKDPLLFNALETSFVVRSGERRRNRFLGLGLIVVAVIAGLSVTAIIAQINAELARQSQVKAEASQDRAEKKEHEAEAAEASALHSRLVAEAGRPDKDVTQEQALLLSVEAQTRRPTLETDSAMRAVQDRAARTAKILRFGQDLAVSGLAWSPAPLERHAIAGTGAGQSVVLWNAETGAELSRLKLDASVDQVSWSPLAERLLVDLHAGLAHRWALVSTAGDALRALTSEPIAGTESRDVEWSRDGKLALTVATGEAVVWSADASVVTGRLKPEALEIAEGHLMPDGKEVLLCGARKDKLGHATGHAAIYAVPPSRPRPARAIVEGGPPVEHCQVSPDGAWYATATKAGVELWSRRPGKPRHLQDEEVAALGFDHGSNYLAAGSTMGTAEFWSVQARSDRARLEGHSARVVSVQWSEDDKRLLTASIDGTAIIWNRELSTRETALSGHGGPLTGAAWDPQDPTRVATSSEDGTVRVFQLGLGDSPAFGGIEHDVVDAAYDPSGQRLAIADNRGVVAVFAADGTTEVHHFGGDPGGKILAVRYCPDGATLVTLDDRRAVRLWAADSGAPIRTMRGLADADTAPTCSHDGRFIAALAEGEPIVWDAASGAPAEDGHEHELLFDLLWHPRKSVLTGQAPGSEGVPLLGPDLGPTARSLQGGSESLYALAWSHDGDRLARADLGAAEGKDELLHIYDRVLERTGGDVKPTREVPQPGNEVTHALAWSPDDALLVTVGNDGGRVWDTESWTLKAKLKVPELTQVAWSPRGDRIAAVDRNGALRLFEPDAGAVIAAPSFEGRAVKSAAWNHDGSRLLVLLADHTARLVTVYQSELAAQLCARAIRNFTRQEWRRYLGDEPYHATCKGLPIEPEPADDGGAPVPPDAGPADDGGAP